MKRITVMLVLLSLFIFNCGTMKTGQNVKPEQRKYQKIFKISNTRKNELYRRANQWFVDNFTSAESVIEYQDKESGDIMGKYVFSTTVGIYHHDIRQTISVNLKDGKARLRIKDPYSRITGDNLNGDYANPNEYKPLKKKKGINKCRKHWDKLATSLKEKLKEDTSW